MMGFAKSSTHPTSPGPLRSGERLLDLGLHHLFEVFWRERADQLVGDAAIAPDDEGLGHPIDAPLDRRAAVGVGAGGGEGIAETAEETARIVGLVLVVDADEPDALVRSELQK